MENNLKNKKLFLFDMDGTIYSEDNLFDGTKELLDTISKNGGKYVFITNNSSKSLDDYVKKVNKLGIIADKDNFYTSTQATINYLQKEYKNKLIYCMGTKSLIEELQKNNIKIVTEYSDKVDVVLLGFDTELNYEKLKTVCKILNEKKNIPYIATNPDYACPVNNGFIPDCGAIAKMIEYPTKRVPIFIGKPEPTMINFVMEKYGIDKESTVVIGDRLYTDIASGINAGVSTICVLTGEATEEEINKSSIKPEMVLNSVNDIYNMLLN